MSSVLDVWPLCPITVSSAGASRRIVKVVMVEVKGNAPSRSGLQDQTLAF